MPGPTRRPGRAAPPHPHAGQRRLARGVGAVWRRLCAIYRLDLADVDPGRFVVTPDEARAVLPPDSPRTGVAILEEGGELWVGLYVDPQDRRDFLALVEETSHLLCVAWHAARERPVSQLVLELQSEVDRYAVARLRGRDPLRHFRNVRWAPGLSPASLERYQNAHQAARRYCVSLQRRFPARADWPALLGELRAFYRAPAEEKLRAL